MEGVVIRGISRERHQAKLTIAGVPDEPGIAGRILSNIAAAHIIVDTIVQNASIGGTTDISFTLHEAELENARRISMPDVGEIDVKRLNTERSMASASVVGIGMRSHSRVPAGLLG